MNAPDHFVRVEFSRFKAFKKFSLHLRHFNILVGPNNAGKSTILAAFRILAAAIRKANTKSAEKVDGPSGKAFGYAIDLSSISVAEENIFFNYDKSEPAFVRFRLSNQRDLLLYFPEGGTSNLIPDTGLEKLRPSIFRNTFNCSASAFFQYSVRWITMKIYMTRKPRALRCSTTELRVTSEIFGIIHPRNSMNSNLP